MILALILIFTGVLTIWISNNIVPSKILTEEDTKRKNGGSSNQNMTLNEETDNLRQEELDDLN